MLILWVFATGVFVVEKSFSHHLISRSMTWEYRGLLGDTKGYKRLQGVTRGYRALQGVKRGDKE